MAAAILHRITQWGMFLFGDQIKGMRRRETDIPHWALIGLDNFLKNVTLLVTFLGGGDMLEYFISSGSKRRILIYLLKHPDEEYHLRELSRKMGEPAPVVKRELDKLDQMGFILSWAQGNQRRFRVNRNFLLWPELKSIVDKSQTLSTPLKVSITYPFKEIPRQRKSWAKRSREIVEAYGKDVKRRRPRHPSEAKMLENFS